MSATTTLFALAAAVSGAYVWRASRARRLAMARLTALLGDPSRVEPRERAEQRAEPPFPRRYRVLSPAAGIATGALLWMMTALPVGIAIALGILIGVLTSLVEQYGADRQEALIETQLSAAIDLLVASLRAGAGLLAGFESTLREAEAPLRPYFQEVAGRIRLGDDPRTAVGELQTRVPLETFRLFATSLAIHWEVGGSLATTLSTVGATIRDRIELARRVRAQGVESHASVAVVLVLSYVLAYLMWRTNPDRLEAFVQTSIGSAMVAGVIILQAFGLVWMSRMSRSRF